MTDDEYRQELDHEQVARARAWPDLSRVRRVRIYDGPARTLPKQMAQAANADREREGDTENG
jgi:hypothetical protein